ncbi:hypothetical protein TWF225_010606 [Orbilia oligospora]|nr:hypothetical protein TWF225_010606 [Orbilia oligospora]KAF3250952.1 hypothetical protein TWF128_007380 [Orbilia oligospora]KAF3259119.1 hypothetical protein TWF217_005262 [Orbilia oligospora]
MTYSRNTTTERIKGKTHYPRLITPPTVQSPSPLRLLASGPAPEPNFFRRLSISPLTSVQSLREARDRVIRTKPTSIRAESFPLRVRRRILGLLNLKDLQNLISVSRRFCSAYMHSPALITERVGRNSFKYDPNFGKYFPIEYPGCLLESNNEITLPFPPWERYLRHLQLLLDIERDLFKVSQWIHWGSTSTSEPHENIKKVGNQETSSCPLRKQTNYNCGRTYCVLIDFAQRGLYGPTASTFALPNPWGEKNILTSPSHRPLTKKASTSSLGFSSLRLPSNPTRPKQNPAFGSTAGSIEILLVNKLWSTHTRPIQPPCCWKDRHAGMTVRQRPKRFVQIAPFWLMLELFECQGMIRCLECDPKAGKWWNAAYLFYWDLATYWAVNAPGSVDSYMK